MNLSHFSAAFIFALCIGVVFGITQRSEPKMMIRFGAYCFSLLMLLVVAGSWAMWLIHH